VEQQQRTEANLTSEVEVEVARKDKAARHTSEAEVEVARETLRHTEGLRYTEAEVGRHKAHPETETPDLQHTAEPVVQPEAEPVESEAEVEEVEEHSPEPVRVATEVEARPEYISLHNQKTS
jgi:hypothetical protein